MRPGPSALLRRGGWIKAFRSARGEDMANREAEELKPYGITPTFLDRAALIALEPHLSERAIGGGALCRPAVDARSRGAGAELRGAVRRSAAAGWRQATR